MKKILITLLYCFVVFYAKAQQPVYHWAKAIGNSGDDVGHCITTDIDGNVYTIGAFYGIVDFDPGPGVFNLTSAGDADIFVSKLNKSGDFIWAKSMGGANMDRGYSIAIDNSGNIYTTGIIGSTADFDPGPNNFYLTAASLDVFISKLDSSGNFVWAKSFDYPSPSSYGYGTSICIDNSNNVYTTGVFSGTADFDPGPNIVSYTSNGYFDIFISKLDSNGNFVYAKTMGGTGWDIGFSIKADNLGNVYSTGYFRATADFDPGNAIYNLFTTANQAAYILKLDTAGNFVWAKSFSGASGFNQGNDITLDSASNVYTTGYYNGPVDFDPGPNIFNLIDSGSFISKLDSAGNFIFTKSFDNPYSLSIALDKYNNIYTTGLFSDTFDVDPGVGVYNLIPVNGGGYEMYVSKLDSLGNFSWALSISAIYGIEGHHIHVDSEGSVLTTGAFYGITDFNPGLGVNYISTQGNYDAFALKLKQCFPSSHSLSVTTCNNYTFNGYNYSSSGVYYDTLINSSGCDSLITLNLTINSPSDTINQSSCTSWFFNGSTLTSSGMYSDTLLNSAGCDSVITLNLTINQASADTITATACNSYYFNGIFLTSSGIYYDTLTNAVGCDSVITLNLFISNQSSFNTLNMTSCNNYYFNGQQLTSSGIYSDTLINAFGCDSILTLNLNIISFDTSVSQSGYSMWSNLPQSALSSYQWINCNDNSVITGATSQGYTTTTNGSYAVIMNYSGCIDTSECLSIFPLGLENSVSTPTIYVYPNPSNGVYTLSTKSKVKDASLKIYNLTGESIFSKEGLFGDFFNFNISEQLKGLYILELRSQDIIYRIKIIKK